MVVWGRRRLLLLLDLLQHAQRVSVRLAGTAKPSFWSCHLPHACFTLGLTAWSARDWTRTEAWTLFEPQDDIGPEALRGRVLHDPSIDVSVAREIVPGLDLPPSPAQARLARARSLAKAGAVDLVQTRPGAWSGQVQGRTATYAVELVLGPDATVLGGRCACAFFRRFSLLRGPCKHLLAAREVCQGV